MANFEVGYCARSEYEAGEPARIANDEIAVGELYVVMFALQGWRDRNKQAAKYPAQISDVEHQDNGLCQVDFTIMNADMAPDLEAKAGFRDGLWQRATSEVIIVGKRSVKTGYFRQYSDSFETDLWTSETQDLEAPLEFSDMPELTPVGR